MSTWQTIAAAERDAYSPINQELLTKYWTRDECLRHRFVPVSQVQGTAASTTFVLLTKERLYVPEWASQVDVITDCVLAGSGCSNAALQLVLGTSVVATDGAATGPPTTVPVPAALLHTEADFRLEAKVTGAGCSWTGQFRRIWFRE